MTGQQLKNSILQMAVQGKLVPQNPNDEPASVLLERIRKEKEQLIKEGKIKREKNLSYIFRGADNLPYEKVGKNEPVCIADEVPFEIPESWEWVRLGEVFQHNTGKTLNASNRSGELLTYITTSNLYWNRFELDSLREMYFSESEIEKCTATKGDLLVCEGGDIGRAAIWEYDTNIRIQNHIHRLRSYSEICTEYYYYVFFLYKHAGWIGGKGISIQGLSANALHALLFPLPPLTEQYRIADKIKEFEPFLDKYAQAEKRLNNLNNQFPDLLKKSILQEAVQGKLVPQDPADEPASVLLKRIRSEKEQLIKAGKIKRDKHESVIFRRDNSHYEKRGSEEVCIDEYLPFELPNNWQWERLINLYNFIDYRGSTPTKIDTGVPLITAKNVKKGYIDYKIRDYISEEEYCTRQSRGISQRGDILFTTEAPLGNVALADLDQFSAGQRLITLQQYTTYPLINNNLVMYFMLSDCFQSQLIEQSTGTTVKGIKADKLKQLWIPVPPLQEQVRILAQLRKVLEACIAL
ncbi:restriction endonuclease subunit S [Akkermansia muciniphila]|uniref:restriction endonuclease subunit S n=1 Tax=Akkermansia muciniphila TaxID=239935 RepID=UPI001C061316|nr:restriction endonuclease subunit S [Akkermansia muciniphila]QWO83211.1 restriction endonuclease subunit S [Akkermansia muciniphila]